MQSRNRMLWLLSCSSFFFVTRFLLFLFSNPLFGDLSLGNLTAGGRLLAYPERAAYVSGRSKAKEIRVRGRGDAAIGREGGKMWAGCVYVCI